MLQDKTVGRGGGVKEPASRGTSIRLNTTAPGPFTVHLPVVM